MSKPPVNISKQKSIHDILNYSKDSKGPSKNPTAKGPETESRKPHNPRLIGQGTYGCVYYDDIILSKTDILSPDTNIKKDDRDNPYLYDYTTKLKSDTETGLTGLTGLDNIYNKMISKFGETKEMNIEANSYNEIFDIDPTYKYHYPKPLLIKVDKDLRQKLSATLLNPLSTCNVYRSSPASDFSILLMNYGGNDLNKYIKNLISKTNINQPTITNQLTITINIQQYLQKINIFFKHFKNIIEGINKLSENNFIHGDLKPENIVYDNDDNDTDYDSNPRMKLIDFGISKTFLDFRIFNNLKTNYFYFPPEIILLDVTNYYRITNSTIDSINNFVGYVINYVINNNNKNEWSWYSDYLNYSGLNYFNNINRIESNYILQYHRDCFKEFILEIKNRDLKYDEFVEMYFKYRDYYGLGYTLLKLLKKICECYNCINFINDNIFNNFINMAVRLNHFNLFKREEYIKKLISESDYTESDYTESDYSIKSNEFNDMINQKFGGKSTNNMSHMSQDIQPNSKNTNSSNTDIIYENNNPNKHKSIETINNFETIKNQIIKEIEDQEKEIKINDEVLYYLRKNKEASEENPNRKLINEKLSQIKEYMKNIPIPKLTDKKKKKEIANLIYKEKEKIANLTKEYIKKSHNIKQKPKSKSSSKKNNKKLRGLNFQRGPGIPKTEKTGKTEKTENSQRKTLSQGGFRIRRISKTIKKKSPPKTPRKTTSRKTRI